MAVNQSRSMMADFHQGSIDRSYIELTPNRGQVENVPVERLAWPTYGHCGMYPSDPFAEAHMWRSQLPREIKTTGDGDTRV